MIALLAVFVLAAAGLVYLVETLALLLRREKGGCPVEIREALGVLVEAGCDVERRGHHLYKGRGGYTVLSFGPKGDLRGHDPELEFATLEGAVSAFADLARPGQDT